MLLRLTEWLAALLGTLTQTCTGRANRLRSDSGQRSRPMMWSPSAHHLTLGLMTRLRARTRIFESRNGEGIPSVTQRG
jgi:hypothetical protein